MPAHGLPPQTLSVMVTGATRGLGAHTVTALAAIGARVLVAGRDDAAAESLAVAVGGRAVRLDLADLSAVARTAASLSPEGDMGPVDVVVANAAVQMPEKLGTTVDGWETTVQVNHLAHLALLDALLVGPHPPRRVVLVGSASHDPARTSLPAPWEGDVRSAATGHFDRAPADQGSAGMRQYSTSKLLVTATALGLAREHPEVEVICFDPGAMLATGLYRHQGLRQRVLFALTGRWLARRPGFSTPARSGRALAQVALNGAEVAAGYTQDADGGSSPVSATAARTDFQDRVLRQSRELLKG